MSPSTVSPGKERLDDFADRMRAAYRRRWHVNQAGGAAARLSRWRVIHYVILRRIGWHGRAKARTFWGAPIYVHTAETTSGGLLAFGYHDTALTALMLETIKLGMRLVDIGAHLGYESMLGAELVGRTGRVVSFEPQRQIFGYTERNLRRYPQVRVMSAAVGERNGVIDFHERALALSAFSGSDASAQSATGSEQSYTVPVVKLDEALRINERPVDFIKCDVEGAEMSVLRGACDILREDRPLLVLEAEMPVSGQPRPRIQEFSEFLAPFGYRPVAFDFDGTLRIGRLDELDMGHANVAFVHPSRKEFAALMPT